MRIRKTTKLDAELVRKLIRTQFSKWADLDVGPVEIGGWDNRTFHLGSEMLVRLPSVRRYVAQVEKEQLWLAKLAPDLPLSVPLPLAKGAPGEGYPWTWSVYRWIEGATASASPITDLSKFATDLAAFLRALQRIDPAEGPPPGAHNFFRGGPLTTYDAQARQAMADLRGQIDVHVVAEVWDAALMSAWQRPPVWLHGDVSAGNLLVDAGRLCAVIDFGCCGVGDPACDLAIAWTFFEDASREAFRAGLPLDATAWARGRGWTLWKALIVWAGQADANPMDADKSRRIVDDVVADHRRFGGSR